MTRRRATALVVALLLALAPGCGGGGGGGGAVDFPAFVKAQINQTPSLETRDAVPIDNLTFLNVLNEDPDQFDDILGH